MKKTGKDALLAWCKQQTRGYHGVDVSNFSASWRDGLALCALVHSIQSSLIPWDNLNKADEIGNLNIAFTAAEKLGVPKMLDAEDMSPGPPEPLSMITYLSTLYHTAASKVSTPATNNKSSPESTPSNGSQFNSAKPPTEPTTDISATPCANCLKPAGGMVVEWCGSLYHKDCFKCAGCNRPFRNQCLNIENKPYCDSCGRKAFVQSRLSRRRESSTENIHPNEQSNSAHAEELQSGTKPSPASHVVCTTASAEHAKATFTSNHPPHQVDHKSSKATTKDSDSHQSTHSFLPPSASHPDVPKPSDRPQSTPSSATKEQPKKESFIERETREQREREAELASVRNQANRSPSSETVSSSTTSKSDAMVSKSSTSTSKTTVNCTTATKTENKTAGSESSHTATSTASPRREFLSAKSKTISSSTLSVDKVTSTTSSKPNVHRGSQSKPESSLSESKKPDAANSKSPPKGESIIDREIREQREREAELKAARQTAIHSLTSTNTSSNSTATTVTATSTSKVTTLSTSATPHTTVTSKAKEDEPKMDANVATPKLQESPNASSTTQPTKILAPSNPKQPVTSTQAHDHESERQLLEATEREYEKLRKSSIAPSVTPPTAATSKTATTTVVATKLHATTVTPINTATTATTTATSSSSSDAQSMHESPRKRPATVALSKSAEQSNASNYVYISLQSSSKNAIETPSPSTLSNPPISAPVTAYVETTNTIPSSLSSPSTSDPTPSSSSSNVPPVSNSPEPTKDSVVTPMPAVPPRASSAFELSESPPPPSRLQSLTIADGALADSEMAEMDTELQRHTTAIRTVDINKVQSGHQGFLKRKIKDSANPLGNMFWTQLWFSLQDFRLLYYKEEMPRNSLASNRPPDGFLSLQYVTSIRPSNNDKKFTIEGPGVRWALKASSREEVLAWIDAMNDAVTIHTLLQKSYSTETRKSTPVFEASKSEFILEGTLERHATFGWSKQYFLLQDGMLYYFEKQGGKRLGRIPLYHCNFEPYEASANSKHANRAFCITTFQNDKIILAATDEMEMHHWLNCMLRQRIIIEEVIDMISF